MTTNTPGSLPIALVTGASQGIGEAFALLLAQEGYQLVLVALGQSDLEQVAAKIAADTGTAAHTIEMDLSEVGAAETLFAELRQRALLPDMLVNNAGFGLMGPALELDLAEQRSMINLNVATLTELSILCGRQMAERGEGGIINMGSVAGTLPGPNMAVYYATKAYILSFTEALAVELKGTGVKVTAVAPGITRTKFHERASMEDSVLLQKNSAMSAEAVARLGYEGFKRGRRVVITGGFNRFSALCTRLVPTSVLNLVTAGLHKPAPGSPRLTGTIVSRKETKT